MPDMTCASSSPSTSTSDDTYFIGAATDGDALDGRDPDGVSGLLDFCVADSEIRVR
jgi:hypothetical protein